MVKNDKAKVLMAIGIVAVALLLKACGEPFDPSEQRVDYACIELNTQWYRCEDKPHNVVCYLYGAPGTYGRGIWCEHERQG